ncbi:MAG: RNA methyltransferase, partial [Flavobacteriaceae bacterium]|nr:RNA methyltransferase [Flavobacteriaceae bacterium]
MRFHQNQIAAIKATLDKIFRGGAKADGAVHRLLKSQKRWGSRDRRLVAGAIYDIVRYKRKYEAVAADLAGGTDHASLFWVWAVEQGYTVPEWASVKDLDAKKIQ